MYAHRKWHHRTDIYRRRFDSEFGSIDVRIPPVGYYGDPYAELIDERDELGGPLATVWLPLGAHGEGGMTINRQDAQAIVNALREVFPPQYARAVELSAEWPGIL